MNAGCNAHITKPFSKVKLLDAILKQTKGDNCVNESNLNKENQKTIVHVSPYI